MYCLAFETAAATSGRVHTIRLQEARRCASCEGCQPRRWRVSHPAPNVLRKLSSPITAAAASSPPVLRYEESIPCEGCKGRGWLVCDFCNGQCVNVQVRSNKFYRRCPSCKAVGMLVCEQCRVFKCLTFADEEVPRTC